MRHKDLRPSDVHSVIAWNVGSMTERQQIVATEDDIGKFCYQSDTKSFFVLRSSNPTPDWQDMTEAQVGNHYHTEFEPKDVTILKAASKGVANGVASLGSDGKIPASQLPSYVDDIVEFSTLASLPTTGESGKIYVTTSDNKQYRWSGSAYVVFASGGSTTTDGLPEGTTNKYFTDARAKSALVYNLSLKADLSYVNSKINEATTPTYSNRIEHTVVYVGGKGPNNSTYIVDQFGHSITINAGTKINTAVWQEGAIDCTAPGQGIIIRTGSDAITNTHEHTIEFWCYMTGLQPGSGLDAIISGPNWWLVTGNSGYWSGWSIMRDPTDKQSGNVWAYTRTFASSQTATGGTWQHVAINRNHQNEIVSLYVDGVLQVTQDMYSFGTLENGATSGDIYIGGGRWLGYIRDIKITKGDSHYTGVNIFSPAPNLAPIKNAPLTIADVTGGLGYTPVDITQVGAASGVASLGPDGKLAASQVPAIAVTDTFVVASQAAQVALTTAEKGDICVRTDINKTYILTSARYDLFNHWQELATPTDSVTSVFGRAGVVTMGSSDVVAALGFTPYNNSNPTGYITGNQTITFGGDASGTGSTAVTLTLAGTGVTPGTYSKVTVDAKGRATAGAQLSAADIETAIGFAPGPDKARVSKCTFPGTVSIRGSATRWYPEVNSTITQVYFSVGTAPSAGITIDVKKNGSSIFATKPTCAGGQNKSTVVNVNVAITTNDSITVDIIAGSDGSDLVAFIVY